MLKFFSLFFSLFLLVEIAHGQSVSIASMTPENNSWCVGGRVFIKYTVDGTFNADNKFSVEIKPIGYEYTKWESIPSIDSAGILIVPIAENFKDYPADYLGYIMGGFRIRASSPEIVSEGLFSWISAPASVDFKSIEKQVVYPYESITINATIKGTSPFNVVMSDSSKITVYGTYPENPFPFQVSTNKSTTFKVVSVSNHCGTGKATGAYNLTVVDKRLQLISLVSPKVCKGGKVSIYYEKSGDWATNTKLRLRLTNTSYGSFYFGNSSTTEGLFTATIPDDFSLEGNFEVRLVASGEPEILSNAASANLTIVSKFQVAFATESSAIAYGETKGIKVALKGGFGLCKFELNNGQLFEVYDPHNNPTVTFNVSPKTTTDYSIKSFTSSCGVVVGNSNTVRISVNKGIITDSLKAGFYCEGSVAQVKFSSNGNIPVGTKVKVRLTNYCCDNLPYEDTDGVVTNGNWVNFTIPTNLSAKFERARLYAIVYTDEMPNTTKSPNYITVGAFPSGYLSLTEPELLQEPGSTSLYVNLSGTGPYTFELSNHLTYEAATRSDEFLKLWDIYPVYSSQTTDYSIVSVSNRCGTNKNLEKIVKRIEVAKSDISIEVQSVDLQKNAEPVCAGAKLSLNLIVKGDFDKSNTFTAELTRQGIYPISLGTVQVGKTSVTIPADLYPELYTLKISSSYPYISSNTLPVDVQTTATVNVINSSNITSVYMGQASPIKYEFQGGGMVEATYLDGTTQTHNLHFGGEVKTGLLYKTTTFGVLSLKNACGVGKVLSPSITINVLDTTYRYKLVNQIGNGGITNRNASYCLNEQIFVPFDVVGTPKPDVTFAVQIVIGQDAYTLMSGIKGSPAVVTIPEVYQRYNAGIKIVGSDGVSSEVVPVYFTQIPDATLKLLSGSSETKINAGEEATLSLASKTMEGWSYRYVITDDRGGVINGGNTVHLPYSTVVKPLKTTEYTLVFTGNQCGPGKVSGKVKITVDPTLKISLADPSKNIYCVNGTADMILENLGEFGADNKFSVYVQDGSNVFTSLFTATKNGKYTVSLDKLKPGAYKLFIESSNPYKVKEQFTLYVTQTPDVTLYGMPIINQGDRAILEVKNNVKYGSFSYSFQETLRYELSDGSKGEAYVTSNGFGGTIIVNPTSTTTYTLKNISNSCGVGKVTGSAVVTVNSPANQQVNMLYALANYYFCTGGTMMVYFTTKGTLSASNKFTVQLSDSTGLNYKNLVTEGQTSPLKATIPADLPAGYGYYVRVIASDKDVTSTTNERPYTLQKGVTGKFEKELYSFRDGNPVTIKLNFTGTPPYSFYIGNDELSAKQYVANTPNFELTVNPLSSVSYRLFQVSNNTCGIGTVLSPSTVRIELITALEELAEAGVKVFPNPTSELIQIETEANDVSVQVVDLLGKTLLEKSLKGSLKTLNISTLPAGTYILRIVKDNKEVSFRMLKL